MTPPASPFSTGLADGTQLSHYRLVERIGAGGMGVVYRALDTRLDRLVALKVIGQLSDPDRRQRFIKEARAAAAFNHPNIVTIYQVDADAGVDFIVMELLSGEPLGRRIRPGGLPASTVLDYAEQIASALEAAHAAGIVHRDIKPANVMVSESGQVKLLDFGVAKVLVPTMPDATTTMGPEATRVGAVLGSAGYMSPEQAGRGRGREVGRVLVRRRHRRAAARAVARSHRAQGCPRRAARARRRVPLHRA